MGYIIGFTYHRVERIGLYEKAIRKIMAQCKEREMI